MTKEERRYSFYASLSSLLAIAVVVLFCLQVFSALDIYMTVNYVSYFVGLALIFTGMYCREKKFRKTKIFTFVLGTLFVVLSVIFLVYGFVSGNVSFDFTFTF